MTTPLVRLQVSSGEASARRCFFHVRDFLLLLTAHWARAAHASMICHVTKSSTTSTGCKGTWQLTTGHRPANLRAVSFNLSDTCPRATAAQDAQNKCSQLRDLHGLACGNSWLQPWHFKLRRSLSAVCCATRSAWSGVEGDASGRVDPEFCDNSSTLMTSLLLSIIDVTGRSDWTMR